MSKIKALMIAVSLAATTQAFAADEEKASEDKPGEGENSSVNTVNEPVKEAADDVQKELDMKKSTSGYGSAGCGLGTLLFQPSNGFTQVFAATTNGTSGTQTFGITSGTSNCDAAGYQPGSTAAFIQTNRGALAKDIARGKGATITGLTDLAGCKDTRAVGKTLQKRFGAIFPGPSATDTDVSHAIIDVLKNEQSLACANLA